MDSFYLIVVIVAAVLLIICLAAIGVLMRYQNAGMIFPPSSGPCPDGWTSTSDGKYCNIPSTINSNNLGIIHSYDSNTYTNFATDTSNVVFMMNGSTYVPYDPSFDSGGNLQSGNAYILFGGNTILNDTCSKYRWANKYNVNWDGVSNSRNC
jgi:hypothetical protein